MTKYKGQCLISCCPVRKSQGSTSEMVTQLLYGQQYDVNDQVDDWLHITIDDDGYSGWISENQYADVYFESSNIQINSLFLKEDCVVPMGGRLRNLPSNSDLKKASAIDRARLFIGCPYLWGGKTFMGVDCSGLMQVVFSQSNFKLPRDAYQQAACGKAVTFDMRMAGDLAFFENAKGQVTHVGLLSSTDSIIHASGWVREDFFDRNGIHQSDIHKHTHVLNRIRRLG